MTYREGPIGLPGVVLWQRTAGGPSRILPDGCLDLIWDFRELVVAGPDSAARWHDCPPDTDFVGLRFHYGIGPALLSVVASDVTDQTVRLEDMWSSRAARTLTEQAAEDPVRALGTWLGTRAGKHVVDPLGGRVHAMAALGMPVARMAERLGLSERHLHRRCLRIFGYGPRRLAKILRLNRALNAARGGTPLAEVAADCGYADQAHLCREMLALGGATPTTLLAETLVSAGH